MERKYMKFEMTQATAKGNRSYQEDRSVVYWVPDEGYLLATFDGHGGSECADHCAKVLVPLIHSLPRTDRLTEDVIHDVFKTLNDETETMGPGCAASIAFIPKDGTSVIVGVLGDAPVLVKKADGELWLAPEHNVRTNREEADAAVKRGGFVQSGYLFVRQSIHADGLQMSRALGDRWLTTVLNREPEIFRLPTGPDSFVLVATDGLFDPTHATQPGETIAAAIEAGHDANQLVQNALAVPTYDNVTAILVKLSEGE
jgi:serine/threonine protein phosphatase PrpC